MRLDELEKKAEEWLKANTRMAENDFGMTFNVVPNAKDCYMAGLKTGLEENEQLKQQLENEKQLNAEIKKRLIEVEYDSNDLLKQKYEENKQLAKRICELQSDLSKAKSQIEKMKCCGNCKHKNERYQVNGICDSCFSDDDKWELKESKRISE